MINLKKTLIFASSLLISSVSFAENKYYFYGGLSTGAAYKQSDLHRTQEIHATTLNIIAEYSDVNDNTQRTSGFGTIQLGAGASIDSFYLGIEALGEFSNGSFEKVSSEFNAPAGDIFSTSETQLSLRDFEPALDLKPGFFISKASLLYARVGMAFNKLKIADQIYYNIIANPPFTQTANVSESENIVGLRLGLGLEHHLHERFTILIDYTYTQYGDIQTSSLLNGELGGGAVLLVNTSNSKAMDVNKQTARIGFNYYL